MAGSADRLHGCWSTIGWLTTAWLLLWTGTAPAFTAFETGQVRGLAQSSDGSRLFAVNTPDNQLEIFAVSDFGLTHEYSVPVGLEPVAVALRNDNEAWVVNHLSDSVTIINLATDPPRIQRTLLVGDEPRDIVFAGTNGGRAFISTAHRGQNSPWDGTDHAGVQDAPGNPGELITPGIGRADIWVFNAGSPGSDLGGTPEFVTSLFGDTPRPLAVSPDGNTVYAGIFHSGNRSTVIPEGAVCDGGQLATCTVDGVAPPGGLPPPNVDVNNAPQPEVGLIVKYDGTHWVDELNRQWDGLVRFNLPDLDVFAIDANAAPNLLVKPPVPALDAWSGVGTILYNIAVHPQSGKLFVANTEAHNEVRFEGTRAPNDPTSTVLGHQHETRITIIDPVAGTVTPRHLNKHIDYSISPAPAGTAENSLALPRQPVISSDGSMLYLAAKGSDRIGVFSVAALETDSFVPDSADHIPVSGGGPESLLLDETRRRLYVTTRFDNGVSIINLDSHTETAHFTLHNPEPADLVAGRRFLYDATHTSSNGEAACASCHVDGDFDSLAWDLGNPADPAGVVNNPLDMIFAAGNQTSPAVIYQSFHPLKGPMTTQTLRGMQGHGSMHWRGDRTGGHDEANVQPDGGAYNEALSFSKFNVAFPGLLGRVTELPGTEMDQFTAFILQVTPPPNPVRNLDNSLTADQQAGLNFYTGPVSDGVANCNGCHTLDVASGFLGTAGLGSFELESQHMKIPQLRNLYTKVGMFGMAAVPFFNPGDNAHRGDQIRGFGFLHDGSTDTLLRFFNAAAFQFPGGDAQRRQVEQFVLAFDSNLKPVVGQQVTLYPGAPSATGNPFGNSPFDRAALLTSRFDAVSPPDCDVVVKGNFLGVQRGGLYLGGGLFQLDGNDFPAIDESTMVTQALQAGSTVTYTAVPPGEGYRIGLDRDDDTVLNIEDNCPRTGNPSQTDGDSDTAGDACDNCPGTANTDQLDTDTDGQGNACDTDDDNDGLADLIEDPNGNGILDPGDTDPLSTDTDGDGIPDGVEDGNLNGSVDAGETDPRSADTDGDGLDDGIDPLPTVFNHNDGDANGNGGVDAGDYWMTLQAALGLTAVDDNLLAHVDLYPDGAPDGNIGLQDLLLLTQLMFP